MNGFMRYLSKEIGIEFKACLQINFCDKVIIVAYWEMLIHNLLEEKELFKNER